MLCLSVDGLQAGMLGPYGNTWIRTPQFNRMVAGSWIADWCFATRPVPDDVLQALWSEALLGSRRWTLLTDDPMAYAHPRAARFTDPLLLEMPLTVNAPADELAGTQLATLFGKAVEWIQQGDGSSDLWVHTRGMLGPWDAPLELRNQYADDEDPTPPSFTQPPEQMLPEDHDPDVRLGFTHAYAGQVTLLDACLGVLLDAIEAHRQKDLLEVALIGVRGYPLGEHRRVGICDGALYGELVHVPLMLYRPATPTMASRSARLLTHADLPARLLGTQTTAPARDHLIFTSDRDRGIYTPAWFLRESGDPSNTRRELYVKPDDLWEANDVADRCPEIVTGLAEVLAHPDSAPSPLPSPLITSIGE